MNQYVSRSRAFPDLNFFAWVLIVLWTTAVAGSLWWNLAQQRQETLKIASTTAKALQEKDLLYRRWASENGGIYVPLVSKIPVHPSRPPLSKPHVVLTSSGLRLTKVNPAYMMDYVYGLAKEAGQPQGRVTSLNPLSPENAPDPWEEKALRAFEQGETEFSSLRKVGGQVYLQMMHPIITEASCLGCHEEQRYRIGQIRGGISVAVPMAPLWQAVKPLTVGLWWGHGLLWLLGLGGIMFGFNRLRAAHERIVTLMFTDPLTGIANRRIFMESLEGAMSFAQRHQTPLAIIMADLDDFKSVNDSYGHNAGDQVLRAFALLLKESIRKEDLVARFGGEEFMVMLPGTDVSAAKVLGERLRRLWEKTAFPGFRVKVTASFGVAAFQAGDGIASFIGRADQALYQAKKLGKNRVVIQGDQPRKMAGKLSPAGGRDFGNGASFPSHN